jgi:hypothetical protein
MAITLNGTTGITTPALDTSGDVTFADNDKAVFGAGSDLQIYHIADTGNLIQGQSTYGNIDIMSHSTRILDNGSNVMADFSTSGSSSRLFNGADGLKLATTATGCDITDRLTVGGGSADATITVRNASITLPTLYALNTNTNCTGNMIQSLGFTAAGTGWNHFIGYGSIGGSTDIKILGNGNVQNTNNSYGAISDVKLKENIIDATSQWDDIKNLTVRKYSLKSDSLDAPNMLGVIAQEVEAAGMAGLVYETPDRDMEGNDLETVTKAVNYSILYMKAVKALQEAMTRIETLEANQAAMETRLAALEAV